MKNAELKKAMTEYTQANKGGQTSPAYGYLMYDSSDDAIWTDYHYDIGHNEINRYHSETIVNLGLLMREANINITTDNVQKFVADHFSKN